MYFCLFFFLAAVFKETWSKKIDRIGSASPYSRIEGWKIISVIVKAGDDLRQEKLALQLIKEMEKVWKEEGIQVWVYYYSVLITSENSGLVETIKNAISIHSIKKDGYARNLNQKGITFTLYDHFLCTYGDPNGEAFLKAQDCFMRSLAAYSVISYILQLKDRSFLFCWIGLLSSCISDIMGICLLIQKDISFISTLDSCCQTALAQ